MTTNVSYFHSLTLDPVLFQYFAEVLPALNEPFNTEPT